MRRSRLKRLGVFNCLVMAVLSSVAYAGGIEGSGVGTRALSMGGAFVALADDWSAPFWNPAGLAFFKGWGVGQGVDMISLRALDADSIANPLPPITRSNVEQGDPFFQLGGEPSRLNATDTTIQAALPSLVGYKAWTSWTFSAGVFSPLGFAFSLEDKTVPGITVASFNGRGYVVAYNISLAHQWQNRWAIGVGGNWLDARLSRSSMKQTPTYIFNSTSDGRGQALQGVIGLLGRFTEKISMGVTYKSPNSIDMDGTAVVTDSRLPLTIPPFGTVANEASAVTTELYNPATYTAGFAFFPVSSLKLTTDWEGTDWRPTRTQATFQQPGIFLQNQDFDANWRFTHRARVGSEYRWAYQAEREAAVRLGYTWDPYAVPDSAVSVTNLVDVSRHVYTLGASWRLGNWEPSVGFAYAAGSRTANGVDYKKVDRLLSVGLEYRTL